MELDAHGTPVGKSWSVGLALSVAKGSVGCDRRRREQLDAPQGAPPGYSVVGPVDPVGHGCGRPKTEGPRMTPAR